MSMPATAVRIRTLREDDYEPVIAALASWWGNDHVVRMLPRLFFRHFAATSLAAESGFEGEGDHEYGHEHRAVPAGFLVGFLSASVPGEAHAHFVGVAPQARGQGVGRALYSRFFEIAAERGCTRVTAVTSPANVGSQDFHARVGFRCVPAPGTQPSAPQVWKDWDGPGEDRVHFERDLAAS